MGEPEKRDDVLEDMLEEVANAISEELSEMERRLLEEDEEVELEILKIIDSAFRIERVMTYEGEWKLRSYRIYLRKDIENLGVKVIVCIDTVGEVGISVRGKGGAAGHVLYGEIPLLSMAFEVLCEEVMG